MSSFTSWYQQYDYDELNRLKRVHEYTGNSQLDWQQEFDYDRWGNRTLNATGTWVGNSSNPPNPVLNETQFDTGDLFLTNRLYAPGDLTLPENQRRMRYDAVGNLTKDTYTGAGERVYDAENRMTQAWGGDNQWQYYTYNADGQRTRRKINNQETWQIYGFGGELLAEYAASVAVDQPKKEHGYRNGLLLITAEAGTTAPINVASAANSATVSASSTLVNPPYSYPVSAVNNGDRKGLNAGSGGNWHSATATFPQSVEVAFNDSKTINEVDVFTLQDNFANPIEPTEATPFNLYGVTGFEVQYWNGSWVTVPGGSVTGNNKVWKKITFSPLTTTKIRVLINASTDGFSRLVEIEAWSPGVPVIPTNVALPANGATVSASSTLMNPPYSYPVSAVNNGDRKGLNAGSGGNWHSATANFPQSVEVAFNGSKTIDEVDVFTLQDNFANPIEPTEATPFSLYGVTGFEVQYWNGSWVTVPGRSVTGNDKVWKKITFPSLTTTKIRVLINASADGFSRLVEIEVWTSTSANINWLVSDHLGTPRMIIDETGTLANIKRHDYLPFGEELFAEVGGRTPALGYASGDGVRQQFTRKERDTETGLDYFWARHYSSAQGRFISVDPLMASAKTGDPQTWNRYAYVVNNPLRYVDPDGMDGRNAWDQLTKEEQEIIAPKLNRVEVPAGGSQTRTETPEQAFNRLFTGQNAEETAALVTGVKNFIDGAGGHSNSEVWQQVGAIDGGWVEKERNNNVGIFFRVDDSKKFLATLARNDYDVDKAYDIVTSHRHSARQRTLTSHLPGLHFVQETKYERNRFDAHWDRRSSAFKHTDLSYLTRQTEQIDAGRSHNNYYSPSELRQKLKEIGVVPKNEP